MIVEITDKTPKPTSLTLYPGIKDRCWGHLEGAGWKAGVVYRTEVMTQLTVCPAVRVPKGRDDVFLEGVIEHAWQDDCPEWMLLSVDPADGEVTLCIDLLDGTAEEIDAAAGRAQRFFDAHFADLGRLCAEAADGDDADEEDDEDDEGIGRLLAMLTSR